MLLFLVYCFSFIILSTVSFKPLTVFTRELRMMRLWILQGTTSLLLLLLQRSKLSQGFLQDIRIKLAPVSSNIENVETQADEMSLLDLPELALESILERLSPAGLFNTAAVCTTLRDMCCSDHIWKKLMNQKWGSLVGDAAYQEWQCHIASRRRSILSIRCNKVGSFESLLSIIWPASWIASESASNCPPRNRSSRPDSTMACYQSIQSGKFWFSAQVYNRENGQAGFMLSCYDAKVRYDCSSDTFQARFTPFGRPSLENNIRRERLRAPPLNIPPGSLHVADCLSDLKPGNHIEIQWRRSKEFPYGWWYGVVGHLESCRGNTDYCDCRKNGTVILEFNQYMPGSQWRRTVINRKDHLEIGNDSDGFYGGIRKLTSTEEIASWERLCPKQILE